MHGLIHTCTIQKRAKKQKLSYTGGTGTPTVGQIVTGGTSHITAVISEVGSGYVVVKTVSGTFTLGETISTGTFSGTLSTQADQKNTSKELEYYWQDDQTGIPCRFYYKSGGVRIESAGIENEPILKCALEGCTIDGTEYRITTTETGYTGTYRILKCMVLHGMAGVNHYELEIKEV